MSRPAAANPEGAVDPALARLADAILIPPFPGLSAPRWILQALDRGLAGVTLFGQNISVPDQVRELTASLRAAVTGDDPVIAIDEEGGDVTRVAYSVGSPYPGNAALGVVDDTSLTESVHRAIGADLATLGINFDLAPCADVLGSADSPAVGTRSFGADTGLVARHTAAAVTGLQGAGVAACTKHFPGHGRTGTDSHEAIATIEGGLEELRRHDLPPFAAAIGAGTIAIMPSHLRLPELTGDLPATVSGAALAGLLRGELGFTGLVVCDALEMRATRDAFGIPGAAVLAVAAGTDLVCLGRDGDEDQYLAVRAALAGAVRDGTLPGARLEEAADRVARLRAGLARTRPAGVVPGVGLTAARRAARMSGPQPVLSHPLIIEVEPRENIAAGRFTWGLSPWAPPGSVHRVSFGTTNGAASRARAQAGPSWGAARDVRAEAEGARAEAGGARAEAGGARGQASGARAEGGDARAEAGGARAEAGGAGYAAGILEASAGRSLVLVVRDAHRDSPTQALVTELLAARPDLVLVEMGLPRWRPPDGTSYLTTYGASRASAQAAAELLGLA